MVGIRLECDDWSTFSEFSRTKLRLQGGDKSPHSKVMTKYLIVAGCLIITLAAVLTAQTRYNEPPRDLSGQWRFLLDRSDSGVNQKWFSKPLPEIGRAHV